MPNGGSILISLLLLPGFPLIYSECLHKTECKPEYESHEKDVCDVYRQDYGAPIPSYTVTRTCGKHGPAVLEDTTTIKLLAAQVREKVPERIVENKGTGAHGYFEVTHDITEYTKATVFSHIGKKTPAFCRFSISVSERGTADTTRSFNGFSCKFYTSDGNWDLLTLGLRVFFIRDPILFPSLIHSRNARDPATGVMDRNVTWDFFTKRQESVPAVLFFYSDSTTAQGFRHINGFSENTYKFVSKDHRRTYVRFTWKTDQGIKNFTQEEAVRIASENPEYFREDLVNNIKEGNHPRWTLCVQLMPLRKVSELKFDPLDVTVLWPEHEFPCRPVGKLVLNRNTENFFTEVDQSAFSPSSLIPGIEPSPDRVLQARLFAYDDAHRYRIGVNAMELPINSPKGVPCCPHSLNRDGFMNYDNQGGQPDYYPSSFTHLHPDEKSEFSAYHIDGTVDRHDLGDQPNWEQARAIYEAYSDRDKSHLANNIASEVKNLKHFLLCRALAMFRRVSHRLASEIEHFGKINPHVTKCY